MSKFDRLSAQDASFLYTESPVAHMHVGSLIIFEDGGFSEQKFEDHLQSRLHMVPRFRKKLAWVPYGQGRPVWIDDPHFDIRFHVRYTGLPKPAKMEQALQLMGRLMSIPLDRTRPLWELWIFDLPKGRKGLIQKTHHCLIDGMSGVDLGTVLLDFSPDATSAAPKEWRPEPEPSSWHLLRSTWTERARRLSKPRQFVESVNTAARSSAAWQRAQEIGEGVMAFSKASLERAPQTSLNQPIGAHRRFETVKAKLGKVKGIKKAAGCTVNDVVLSAVTGGLRKILQSRGDVVDNLVLKAMVPVSVRDPSQRMTYGNQVSMMTADLPVGVEDPVARLRKIHGHMAGIKESKQAVGADFWVKMAEYAPPTVLALAGRAVAHQRMFNLAVTNVPGPQFPLYLLGGKLIEAYPFVPLVGTAALGVAVLSYDGSLNFGLSADWDAVPDLDVFATGITNSIAQMEAAL